MEFSKKLNLGVLIFIGIAFILCYITWLILGDWPKELIYFFIPVFLGLGTYNLKSGYENKVKIENGKERSG